MLYQAVEEGWVPSSSLAGRLTALFPHYRPLHHLQRSHCVRKCSLHLCLWQMPNFIQNNLYCIKLHALHKIYILSSMHFLGINLLWYPYYNIWASLCYHSFLSSSTLHAPFCSHLSPLPSLLYTSFPRCAEGWSWLQTRSLDLAADPSGGPWVQGGGP